MCGHSYGGAVITAAAAGLPGVVELVYLAAFQLQEGESCADRNPPTPNAAPTAVLRGDYLHADPLSAPDRFYATAHQRTPPLPPPG